MKMKELGDRIEAHLKRFESDPAINVVNLESRSRDYYYAYTVSGRKYIRIRYILYHPEYTLTREEAEAYLAWLDAGNVGQHYVMEMENEED